ncbi:hypothetical protein KL918_003619 [Ogataea parapolymorpha]|uniref:chitinase n=1 Tax=Ogataea parapolymorpha (strain ATCC 26012 / BCRC 20466 / JCM 22074 / NRRL Y-7560 / DL-1) TaxID=871575 RepID=W1QLE6_OGAPD|nr:CTS1 Endochitinase [Ogataea parapolymorpha DL-1]ESX02076.1 CTS1 Endochitinase [Ogataea parapolymorpha DL-1]KAG7866154.1 hypothetical protein KL918_003619 [Ogataea parapolymorpha]KAG7871287.1 hypothetical protein KL916_004082 [Ogataea parapolymorpha]
MIPTLVLKQVVSALFLFSTAQAFDAASKTNVALYWGQNSAGTQDRLSTYCESDAADIFLLSFMTTFSDADTLPTLNFANACSSQFSDGLLQCDTIAEDIKTCQGLGKKVLLSLGGASGSYGFSSDSVAEEFAGTLWNMFGGGDADERPFGDAVIDGFDFDIENNDSTGYAALATKLREYYSKDSSKDYYISAAPQCVYPDASTGDMLANADVDFAFIQFYNNYCNVDKQFNWDTWANFAANTSPNKDIKLYLGLPASSTAASTGYVDVDTVKSALESIDNTNLGGIMLWDASQAFSNEVDGGNYAEAMKSILIDSQGTSSTSSATTVSSSTSKSFSSTSSESASSTSSSVSSTSAEKKALTSSSSSVSSSSSATSSTTVSSSSTISSALSVPTSTSVSSASSSVSTNTPATSEASSAAPSSVSSSFAPSSSETLVSSSSVTATSTQTPQPTPPSTTLLTRTTSSTSSSSTTATPSAAYTDCSSLSGLEKAKCLNANFASGLFNGSPDSCSTEGEIACSSDGSFAICNFGKWVKMQCAAGTTCYAYVQNSDVDVGCNYEAQKNSFTKRDGFMDIFKRSSSHSHHAHRT